LKKEKFVDANKKVIVSYFISADSILGKFTLPRDDDGDMHSFGKWNLLSFSAHYVS